MRGQQPWPDWVVTSRAAMHTELGVLTTDKEADVFLVERLSRGPQRPEEEPRPACRRARHQLRAAGCGIRLAARGVRGVVAAVPARAAGALSGAGRRHGAADGVHRRRNLRRPAVVGIPASGTDLTDLDAQVAEIALALARQGCAHGDLSPDNLLVHRGRVVAIDLPQLVDVVANPNGMALLERDCRNVCDWFTRRGHRCDGGELFAQALGEMF